MIDFQECVTPCSVVKVGESERVVTLRIFDNRPPMEILATPFAHLSARSPRYGLEVHDIGI